MYFDRAAFKLLQITFLSTIGLLVAAASPAGPLGAGGGH